MSTVDHYFKILHWNLKKSTVDSLLNLDWKALQETTSVKKTVLFSLLCQEVLNQKWCVGDFFEEYGIFFNKVAYLGNFKLPDHIEQQILLQLQNDFDMHFSPVIRLQVIHKGLKIPLHIDATRSASLVIPLANHNNIKTNFFRSIACDNSRQLINPKNCERVSSVVIDKPTLINTKIIHNVESTNVISTPRISLTVKWEKQNFNEIYNKMDKAK